MAHKLYERRPVINRHKTCSLVHLLTERSDQKDRLTLSANNAMGNDKKARGMRGTLKT